MDRDAHGPQATAEPPQGLPYHSVIFVFLDGLGLGTLEDCRSRRQQAERLVDEVFEIADGVVKHSPEIVD